MRRVLTIGLAIIALTFVGSSPAAADGEGECRQDAHDLFVSLSDEGTRGDFMSDVIFGNEPNVLVGTDGPEDQDPGSQAGNIVASQSPGPFTNTGANEPPRNDRLFGFTGGELQALVKAACAAE
jgi:hypothetical protein